MKKEVNYLIRTQQESEVSFEFFTRRIYDMQTHTHARARATEREPDSLL